MNIKDIYLGSVYTFKTIPTLKKSIVRLEPTSNKVSILYKSNGKYEDILTNKVVENSKHIILKGIILGKANMIEPNKEYVLPEYLSSLKEYIEIINLDAKEDLTKKEILEIVKNDKFLWNVYKEEVKNEKSI